MLCELEGKTRREAALQLGIPEGTLSGRLTTGRRRLAQRLTRRGVALSAGALAALLSQGAVAASVPAPLVMNTVKAAAVLAAGKTAAGVVSLKVAALTDGVLKAMLMTKLKMTAAFLSVWVALIWRYRHAQCVSRRYPGRNCNSDRESRGEHARGTGGRPSAPKKEQPKDGGTVAGKPTASMPTRAP